MTFTCLSLGINYYFGIKSIHVFCFANIAIVYKAHLAQGKESELGYKIFYCKRSIYASVSNLTILGCVRTHEWSSFRR